MSRRFDESYFLWLCGRVGCRSDSRDAGVLRLLHNREFYSLVPHDDNRATDGLNLRREFDARLSNAPRVLEMMIALAERMAYQCMDSSNTSTRLFWMMVANMGLTPGNAGNKYIIATFLERVYLANGVGGLFPLRNPVQNQTEVEIWYQMMAYLEERRL